MKHRLIDEYDLPLAKISEQLAHEKTHRVKVNPRTVGVGAPLGQEVEQGPPFRKSGLHIVTWAGLDALQVQRIQNPAAHFQLSQVEGNGKLNHG